MALLLLTSFIKVAVPGSIYDKKKRTYLSKSMIKPELSKYLYISVT